MNGLPSPPEQSADRSAAWIDLLGRLTEAHRDRAVWKNVDQGLAGTGDVDFAASVEDWEEVESEFRRWAAGQGLGPVFACRHVPGSLFLIAVDHATSSFLQLDVRGRATFRGSTLFTAQDLVPLMEPDPRGFRRLRPGAEGLLKLVLSGLGRGGSPRPDALEKEGVAELLVRDPVGAREAARLFGVARRAVLAGAASLTDGRWNRGAMIVVEGRAALRALVEPHAVLGRLRERRAKKWCPVLRAGIVHRRRIQGDLASWLDEVRRSHTVQGPAPRAPACAGHPGRVISVVGPDGSGKTTLIDALLGGVLADMSVLNIRFPSILPRRSWNQGPVTEPHGKVPYSRWISLGKASYLFIDYLLGWIARVRPFAGRGGWVVIQRGWWDMAVDPRRYRLSSSRRLLWLMGRVLPSPDLLLVLEAPPEVVFARKEELELQELERQMRSWREDLPAGQKRVYLDATLPPDEVARTASRAVARLLEGTL